MYRRFFGTVILLLLVVGCGSPAQRAVNELIGQVALDDPMASVTYNENREVLESEEAMPLWIAALQTSASPEVQTWAARLLGRIGNPEAVPALSEALQNGQRDVQEAAASALVLISEEQAEEAFIAAVKDGNRDAKILCLIQLERMGSLNAIPVIAEAAREPDALLASSAITALAGIGSPQAATPLADLAIDWTVAAEVREAAIIGLGRLAGTGPEVTENLQRIVTEIEGQEGIEELQALAQQTLDASQ
jgi:HEAT repeat protein